MSVNDTSRIMIENSSVMLQIVASLTDDSRGVIYDHHMLIGTGHILHKPPHPHKAYSAIAYTRSRIKLSLYP